MSTPVFSTGARSGQGEWGSLVGWSLLGVLTALCLRYAGQAVAALTHPGTTPLAARLALQTGLTHWAEGLVGASSSVVAGAALGTIIGSRTDRWEVPTSGIAAAVAAILWWLGFSGAAGIWGLLGLGTALLMIPAALVAAQHASRRRPIRGLVRP
jgi:hypothetical protein